MLDPLRSTKALERRRALGLALGGTLAAAFGAASPLRAANAGATSGQDDVPVSEIERILQAPGQLSEGVLDISLGRTDLVGVTGPMGPSGQGPRIPFNAGFELNGDFYFQSLGDGKVIMNGDFGFLPHEINPAIDMMLRGGLQFQALHQHYYGLEPMVWFMHMRGIGAPLDLAHALAAVVQTTATPLPQKKPDQSTPLDKDGLGRILGASADVALNNVVAVTVPRTDAIRLGGVQVSPHLNVSTNINFQKLPDGRTAAAPDFSMTESEITGVMTIMRAQGWIVHCLYNQETDEHPQLYYAHMLKVGDELQLAREIRAGLDRTAAAKA